MKKNIINNKYIIILGTTYSGSGAVFDYLSGRGDLYDPLLGTEYQLPQMPNGLMTLESISNNAFHPGTVDYVLTQFKENTKKLSRTRKFWRYGKNYGSMLPFFENEIEQFLKEISIAQMPMNLHWHKLMMSQSPIIYLLSKLKYFLGLNKTPTTRLITSQDNYITATQKLHDKLFQKFSDNKSILLNQAGSGWNPIESTKYFLNSRVVLVTRDPRDQFASLKNRKKARNVEGFVHWYKQLQIHLNNIYNSKLLILKFEHFVNNYDSMVNVLCDHIFVKSDVQSIYDPNYSKKNVGKYKKILNRKEINTIEKNLSEYLFIK